MELELKTPIGEKAFNVFKNQSGAEEKVEISLESYSGLGEHDSGQPSKDGCVWVYSYKSLAFDTDSGSLEDGQYADCGEHYAVKLPGINEVLVDKNAMHEGVLDDGLAAEITTDGGNSIKIWR